MSPEGELLRPRPRGERLYLHGLVDLICRDAFEGKGTADEAVLAAWSALLIAVQVHSCIEDVGEVPSMRHSRRYSREAELAFRFWIETVAPCKGKKRPTSCPLPRYRQLLMEHVVSSWFCANDDAVRLACWGHMLGIAKNDPDGSKHLSLATRQVVKRVSKRRYGRVRDGLQVLVEIMARDPSFESCFKPLFVALWSGLSRSFEPQEIMRFTKEMSSDFWEDPKAP